jgi:hypothetical protein
MKGKKATKQFNPRATIAGLRVESISVFSLLKISSMQMKIKKDFTAMLRK